MQNPYHAAKICMGSFISSVNSTSYASNVARTVAPGATCPRESCAACGSFNWSWERSSGKGQVFSWTVIHRALHPGFTPDVPYATVIIEMAEGVRMVSHVLDLQSRAASRRAPGDVVFDDVTPEVTLPKFHPLPQPGAV